MLDGGPLTTVQDLPGRVGYWDVGVPPSGPMDDLTHRLVNQVVGNDETAPALELTTAGPALRAGAALTFAIGGAAMRTTVDGVAVPAWTAIEVAAGAVIRVGAVDGPGDARHARRARWVRRRALPRERAPRSRSAASAGTRVAR